MGLLLALLLSQCATGITDNAQTLCGVKTLTEVAIIGFNGGSYPGIIARGEGVVLDGPYAFVQTPYGSGHAVLFRSDVPADAAGGGFIFEQWRVRSPTDPVIVVKRLVAPGGPTEEVFRLLNDGTVVAASFKTTAQHSGYPTFFAEKNYVGIVADYPPHYQGEHGAVSVSTTSPCENEAFNLLQASDGKSGTGARTDYTVNVTCLGGRYSRRPPSSAGLPLCNGALGEPPEPNNRYGGCANTTDAGYLGNFGWAGPLMDGGYCYDWTTYYGPDGGYAKDGEVFDYVADVGQGCQCIVAKFDGGLSPAGWFKLSDRTECKP